LDEREILQEEEEMKICVDLDGVLGKFNHQAAMHLGLTCDMTEDCGGGIFVDEDWMLKYCEPKNFWPTLTHDFWRTIVKYPEADNILALCESRVEAKNVCILTSGAGSPAAYAGKMNWILDHFPAYRNKVLVGGCKEFCANQNTLLIDDWSKNITAFRAGSGSAFLYPRPWNEKRGQDGVVELAKFLEKW
jgi:5'(3')-deoxyribonucleotidase